MSGTCGMMGGRRRKTRKMKGGNGYGVTTNASDVIAPGALAYVPNNTSGGPVTPGPTGGRRRKSKKSLKKSKKSRRRKSMRGGGSISGVGASFAGTGSRGIADYVGYASNLPPAGFPIPTGTR